MLPVLHKRQVDACSFEQWYPAFKDLTFRSEVLELPEAFIEYLHADGLVLPGSPAAPPARSDDEDDSTAWTEDEEGEDDDEGDPGQNFPEVIAWIKAAIEKLGGAVMPKLNWSSPKDAVWISTTQTLRCQTLDEVLILLKSSDYVAHDLAEPYAACDVGADSGRPAHLYLVLREWFDLAPSHEFRCFVRSKCLVGISQRDHLNFYDFLPPVSADVAKRIFDFYTMHIANQFPESDFCFDVYLSASYRRVYLVDFNVFGTLTEPLLFTWTDLMDASILPNATTLMQSEEGRTQLRGLIDLRVLTSEQGIQPTSSQLNRLPKDFIDLSTGSNIDAFADAQRSGAFL